MTAVQAERSEASGTERQLIQDPVADPDVVDMFWELFEGRIDKIYTDAERCYDIKMGLQIEIAHHLQGTTGAYDFGIGIYPLKGGHECRWICSDLDGPNSAHEANLLYETWKDYGVRAWLERSKSKGHHVWVFADDWISGTVARRAGLWIHGIAGVPATELNPKQEMLGEDEIGNCVRLPYAGRRYGECRQMVHLSDLGSPTLEAGAFADLAMHDRTPVETLLRLAQKWEPPKLRPQRRGQQEAPDPERVRQNEHIIGILFEGDPVPEGQRDNIFHCLAMTMWGLDWDHHEAQEAAREIWEEQTENNKTYPLAEVLRKVDRAYGVNRRYR